MIVHDSDCSVLRSVSLIANEPMLTVLKLACYRLSFYTNLRAVKKVNIQMNYWDYS